MSYRDKDISSNLGIWKEREESSTHFQNSLCKTIKAKLRETEHGSLLPFLQNLICLNSNMFSCFYEFSSALLCSGFSNHISEDLAIAQLLSCLSLVGNRGTKDLGNCNSPRSQSCNCYSSTGTAGVRDPNNVPWRLPIRIWSTNLCAANLSENKTVCRLDCPKESAKQLSQLPQT